MTSTWTLRRKVLVFGSSRQCILPGMHCSDSVHSSLRIGDAWKGMSPKTVDIHISTRHHFDAPFDRLRWDKYGLFRAYVWSWERGGSNSPSTIYGREPGPAIAALSSTLSSPPVLCMLDNLLLRLHGFMRPRAAEASIPRE